MRVSALTHALFKAYAIHTCNVQACGTKVYAWHRWKPSSASCRSSPPSPKRRRAVRTEGEGSGFEFRHPFSVQQVEKGPRYTSSNLASHDRSASSSSLKPPKLLFVGLQASLHVKIENLFRSLRRVVCPWRLHEPLKSPRLFGGVTESQSIFYARRVAENLQSLTRKRST